MKKFFITLSTIILGVVGIVSFLLTMSETSDAFINLGCFAMFLFSIRGVNFLDSYK